MLESLSTQMGETGSSVEMRVNFVKEMVRSMENPRNRLTKPMEVEECRVSWCPDWTQIKFRQEKSSIQITSANLF